MTKYFFLMLFVLGLTSLSAHQKNISSTMLVEVEEGKWILQVRAALTAFEHEVKYTFPDEKFESVEEFKAQVLQLMQDNVQLSFGDKLYALKDGKVSLAHESSVTYPINIEGLDMSNIHIVQTAFDDIRSNKSAFIIRKSDAKPQQFILNKANLHTAKIAMVNGAYEMLNNKVSTQSKVAYMKGGILAFLLIIFVGILIVSEKIVFKKKTPILSKNLQTF